jgi:hypothetical protein
MRSPEARSSRAPAAAATGPSSELRDCVDHGREDDGDGNPVPEPFRTRHYRLELSRAQVHLEAAVL